MILQKTIFFWNVMKI